MAAYGALASLSQTTNSHTNPKYPFSIKAQEEIKTIHDYVMFLLSFLEDYPEKSNRWEGKMRDLAHETQDIVERFMWQQSYHGRIKASSVKFEEQLRDLIENFCLLAGDVMDDRPSYSPAGSSSSSSSSSSSRVAGNGGVVGLENDLMAIKDQLCGMSSKLEVIPIVGMGGIGKTTLARTVYDDSLIVRHFDIRAWVTISQDYSAQKVPLTLLDSMLLMEKEMSRQIIDNDMIEERVYKILKGRRYLIVMDDVWNTKVWDDVRKMFPDDGNGSRIMLTTRLLDLAAYPHSHYPPHEMHFMNDSQSWDLLKQKLFANKNCPSELEDIGREIAKSCAGLPLVVVLVVGLLSAVNKTRSSWGEIARNVNQIVGQDLEGILSLSYTHLPHHLRPCFLFMGIYPEDEKIRASTLTRLWIAEGFLKQENGCGKSLEEEAEEFLEDLVKRNLVIVNSRKSNGNIKVCCLHDMVRDLCIRKSRDEKFVLVIDDHFIPQGMINERRISYRLSNIDNIWGPTIRTILCFQLKQFSAPPGFLGRLRLLRVFDAAINNYKETSSHLFELFHLRYLVLSSFNIPSVICSLMNLQTLVIFPASHNLRIFRQRKGHWRFSIDVTDFSLPLEIWKMPQLRHLVLYEAYTLPCPPYESNLPLENLQPLYYIKNLVWTKKILEMIPNVKRLGLLYYRNEESHLHLLKHLHQLEKLKICGYYSFSWTGNRLALPKTLKKLILVGVRYPWEDMKVIGSLPNLQVLKLLVNSMYSCSEETWATADGEFLQLRFLLIERSCLRHWITKSSHFPRLKYLELYQCPKLMEIPQGIGEIPTLERIKVIGCNKSLEKSADKIREDLEN